MDDLRRTKGEARIRYHKLTDEPTVEDPACFRLEVNTYLWAMEALKMEEEADTKYRVVLQSGLAAAVPISTWKSSVIDVSWLAWWTAAGLTPIKPVAFCFAQLEGEVWSEGAHLGELRLMNGDEL